jgi:hypothetical protein
MVEFKLHNLVRLQGLSNAAYNGKVARVESRSADEHAGEYRVELQVDEVIGSHLSRQILVKPDNMARACDCCHQAGAATMQYCGRCRSAAYCNAECQRSDWKRHKVDCSQMNSHRQLGKIPLFIAAGLGNLAEVEKLVRAGADMNKATKDDGMTALHGAVHRGQLAVVQYLVQQGADKNKATHDGITPLLIAVHYGHLAVVQCLVQQGADINQAASDGLTPLSTATAAGRVAVANYLREQGAV